MTAATIQFTLNGAPRSVTVDSRATLLEVLRDDCGVISPKDGCSPQGQCGCCTVLVDGQAKVSCATAATKCEGKSILTLEGVPPERVDLFGEAFARAGGLQCGFCIPGIVMRAHWLLGKNAKPTRGEIARSLDVHLCRCTGYVKILDAIEMAAAALRGEPMPEADRSGRVGTRLPKYEAVELALGRRPYIDDMTVDGMLHGAVRLSDHPRARVERIDVAKARALPGVVAVVTAEDVPGQRYQGLIYPDWPGLVAAGEEVRYTGDVLAAVAARSRRIAREAAALVDIDYEVLRPVTSPEEALEPGAPKIHAEGNLLSKSTMKKGDVDAALARCAHVVERRFETQFVEHLFLEPESSLAVPEAEGSLHVYSQGQGVYDDRRQIASFLGRSEEQVRVTLVTNGGAFGGKEDLSIQHHAALLASATGRPVKLTVSREESIRLHPKRHPIAMTYTAGCDAEGRLLAVRARMVGDKGAYASVGTKVLERAAGHATGAYRVDHVDVESIAVYTNNPPCGAMRGFGASQAAFAIEGILDELAAKVGLDGWEMRWRNVLEDGDRFCTGQVLRAVGLKKTLEAVKADYDAAREAGRAVGIGCGIKNVGIGNGMIDAGRATLRVGSGGVVTIYNGYTEMGQGLYTILIQIACEETGLGPSSFRAEVDTAVAVPSGMTTASRATVCGGNAVREAAKRLRADLNRAGGGVEKLAGREYTGEFLCDWTHKLGEGGDRPVTHLTFGYATQMAVLDEQGRIEKIIAAHDVGRAINPTLCEGQIEGSVHMGLGQALTEELVVRGGVVQDFTLRGLGAIRAKDMPAVEVRLVEYAEPDGPYGAKGVGEIGLLPTAGAVAGALFAFDGVRRTKLPMKDTPAARACGAKVLR